jgi:hypothetical protein
MGTMGNLKVSEARFNLEEAKKCNRRAAEWNFCRIMWITSATTRLVDALRILEKYNGV